VHAFAGRATAAVTGGTDATVRIWDLADNAAIGDPMTGHTHWVEAVACTTTSDGRIVAVAGSRDGTVRVWDLATRAQVGSDLPMPGKVLALAVSETGSVVVAGGGGLALARFKPQSR